MLTFDRNFEVDHAHAMDVCAEPHSFAYGDRPKLLKAVRDASSPRTVEAIFERPEELDVRMKVRGGTLPLEYQRFARRMASIAVCHVLITLGVKSFSRSSDGQYVGARFPLQRLHLVLEAIDHGLDELYYDDPPMEWAWEAAVIFHVPTLLQAHRRGTYEGYAQALRVSLCITRS
jgi:hypothetical protein